MKLTETQQAAQKYLVWLLSKREYSKKQLAEKLKTRFPDENLSAMVDWAEEQGYVSDKRFTECYVRDKALISGWGKQKIGFQIFQKGIDRELFESVYEDVVEPTEVLQVARQQATDKWKVLQKRAQQKQWSFWDTKQKLTAFLAGRGYDFDVIKAVTEAVCKEEDLDGVNV
ncbi:hypothetical protein CSB37_03435 [bacterium DOLZORAL124_38_8]|nr:MAG: hypothetical protein CSB37_03435 [bacterium DOLZORAL124_38_8]